MAVGSVAQALAGCAGSAARRVEQRVGRSRSCLQRRLLEIIPMVSVLLPDAVAATVSRSPSQLSESLMFFCKLNRARQGGRRAL